MGQEGEFAADVVGVGRRLEAVLGINGGHAFADFSAEESGGIEKDGFIGKDGDGRQLVMLGRGLVFLQSGGELGQFGNRGQRRPCLLVDAAQK
jgi:hypothetical protein